MSISHFAISPEEELPERAVASFPGKIFPAHEAGFPLRGTDAG